MSQIHICIFFILAFLVVASCNLSYSEDETGRKAPHTEGGIELKNGLDGSKNTIALDTITSLHTPMGFEIAQTNYYLDSVIQQSIVEMKNSIRIEYKLDTIIPLLLDHEHVVDIELSNPLGKIKVLRNEFSFIRASSLYFETDFLFNEVKYSVKYGLNYRGKRKGRFWYHGGLINI